ncbi:MAG: metallophosphoesterase [Ruminococcaceae bacterium]|nr:metallophosphoesterase [Oscillospiraceae bacterium]
MDFLYCTPAVFVIGDEYEILVNTNENGIIAVEIDNEKYYEENSGPLSSEKNYAKIRVPQSALDLAKRYTVVFRKTVERKSYFPVFCDAVETDFNFRPLAKSDNINIYHISDVHYRFDVGVKTASFFGEDTDLFVVNGDIGEVDEMNHYREVARFVGDISKGEVPVLFVRGNHDTRGKLAEMYADYFPANGKNTYFEFDVGPLYGVALDCGEDKRDSHAEYGGANAFEPFRRRETKYFESLMPSDKLTFAVSHVCPAQTAHSKDSGFAIEGDIYEKWVAELERLGVKFMLCGHVHRAYLLKKNDENSLMPHGFPVVVGSAYYEDDLWGTALTISGGKLYVKFTGKEHQVMASYVIDIDSGEINEE